MRTPNRRIIEEATETGTYVGPDESLLGETALLFYQRGGKVLAQFEDGMVIVNGEYAGDCWHEMPAAYFSWYVGSQELMEWPGERWMLVAAIIILFILALVT